MLCPALGEQPVYGTEYRRPAQHANDRPVQACRATRIDHQVHRHHSQHYTGCERHRAGNSGMLKRRVEPTHGPDQQSGCRHGTPAGCLQPAGQLH
jgi:hypothetical protein